MLTAAVFVRNKTKQPEYPLLTKYVMARTHDFGQKNEVALAMLTCAGIQDRVSSKKARDRMGAVWF